MVFSKKDSSHYMATLKLIKKYHIGGIVFSLGSPFKQTKWLNSFQKSSKIPLLVAMDAEWGVSMRLDSIIPFPWNMTLGAIRDTSLIRQIGYRMALQEKRLGVHLSFSPVLDININPNNPIIGNRSFGESKELVSNHSLALMKGHHDAGILTSGKHFPGHGDTDSDSHKILPYDRSNNSLKGWSFNRLMIDNRYYTPLLNGVLFAFRLYGGTTRTFRKRRGNKNNIPTNTKRYGSPIKICWYFWFRY